MKPLITAIAAAAVLLAVVAPAQAQSQTLKIDSIHSTILFRIMHMGVGEAYGRVNEPTGTVVLDESDPSKSSFNIEAQVAKIDTANPKRDEHLRSADFFNGKQFPTMSFKSNKVTKSGKNYEVAGDFTLHGVTKPLTVTIEHIGTTQARGKTIAGFKSTFTIKRSEFDIKGMPEGLGDDVTITVSFEAN